MCIYLHKIKRKISLKYKHVNVISNERVGGLFHTNIYFGFEIEIPNQTEYPYLILYLNYDLLVIKEFNFARF